MDIYSFIFVRQDLPLKLQWPGTHINPPASAYHVLGFHLHTTTPGLEFIFDTKIEGLQI